MQDMLLLVSSHKQQQAVHAGGVRFADALVLLKVWAQQHGLSTHGVLHPAAPACYGPQHSQHGQHKQEMAGSLLAAAATAVQADGFTGHLLSALLIAAVQRTGEAAVSMSSLQLFKAALQLLADKQQWVKGAGVSHTRDSSVPAALRKQHQQHQQHQQTAAVEGKVSKDHARLLQKLQQQLQSLPAPTDTAAAFRKAYGAVLLDGSGHLNLAAGVSSTQLQLAQAVAQQSLSVLNRQSLDPDVVYAAVFKPGQGLARVFHYTWTVELPDGSGNSSNSGTQQQPGDQHTMR
jgi:U3 small nucleolar RNA-associated protein 22